MRILVIGAYGLIGGYLATRLVRDGHAVAGAGREVVVARRRMPYVKWIRADLARMDIGAWRAALAGVDAVVNCAGALQDGPRDDLHAVHVTGVMALADACAEAGVRRFVQISAAGIEGGASAFGRTKGEAEDALRRSGLDWVILRPGLVLAPAAYGGSALLRGLAAFPGCIPAAHADAVVQVVSVEDVAEAVARAVAPETSGRIAIDLVASQRTTLGQVLEALRAWLGVAPAPVWSIPPFMVRSGAKLADALAWLGWRSPMRTAAVAQLAGGVCGEAGDCERKLGFAPCALPDILAGWPSGAQERWFARLYFVKPLGLGVLAAFWMASGVIGIVDHAAAAAALTAAGFGVAPAQGVVLGGGMVDIALGALACHRRTAPGALRGMMLVSAAYLAGATLWRPDLWIDPLGPLVKVIPAAVLALAALAMMDER